MQVTTLIIVICKKYPDAILGMAGAMVFIDAIVLLAWGLTLKHYTENLNLFIGGLGLSIVSSLIDKTIISGIKKILNDLCLVINSTIITQETSL